MISNAAFRRAFAPSILSPQYFSKTPVGFVFTFALIVFAVIALLQLPLESPIQNRRHERIQFRPGGLADTVQRTRFGEDPRA